VNDAEQSNARKWNAGFRRKSNAVHLKSRSDARLNNDMHRCFKKIIFIFPNTKGSAGARTKLAGLSISNEVKNHQVNATAEFHATNGKRFYCFTQKMRFSSFSGKTITKTDSSSSYQVLLDFFSLFDHNSGLVVTGNSCHDFARRNGADVASMVRRGSPNAHLGTENGEGSTEARRE